MSNLAAQELQSFVRRIEALDDEIRALNADKSEVFKEVKSSGFTAKTLRKVIAARRMDSGEREAADEEFDLYWHAVHGTDQSLVRAHVENIEEFPVEHDADGVSPEAGGEAQETAAAVGESPALLSAGDTGAQPMGDGNVVSMSAHIAAGEGASNAPAALTLADKIKKLRPLCQQPASCRSSGGKAHCYTCTSAAAEQVSA